MNREAIYVFKVFIEQDINTQEFTNFLIEKTLIRKDSKELNVFYKSVPYKEAEHYHYKSYFEGEDIFDINRKVLIFMKEPWTMDHDTATKCMEVWHKKYLEEIKK